MAISAQFGDYLVTAIHDHVSPERDPAQVYATVPVAAWDPYRSFALGPNGLYRSIWRGHLVRPTSGDGPLVLVDTGMGPGPHQHTGRGGQLLESLAAEGVRPEQVNAVVITHCHGDHIGWNVTWEHNKPQATFPSATYHIAAADWEHYTKPENRNDAFEKQVRPLKDIGRLKLVHGEEEVAPGIKTLPANGHTPGHQCVLVGPEGQTGVLTGDLFHNVAQVTEQTWCPIYDWKPEVSRVSRASVLGRAQKEGWTVVSGHLPVGRSMGKIVDRNGKPAWEPVL